MMRLFATIAWAAEETVEEAPSGIDLVLPEINELIAGVIAFAIVFLVVWIWARPAIARTLEARQDAITGQLAAAEGSKQEAESLLADYKAQLAKARSEANQIVEDARRAAEALRAEITARAEAEAAEIARRAQDETRAERERATAAIRDEVASLSLSVAQKAVAESIDAKVHKALVDKYIAELGSLAN